MNGPFQHLHSVISPQAASSPSLAQPSPHFLHSARLSLRWNMNPDDSALFLKEGNNFRVAQCNRKRESGSLLCARVTLRTQRHVSTPPRDLQKSLDWWLTLKIVRLISLSLSWSELWLVMAAHSSRLTLVGLSGHRLLKSVLCFFLNNSPFYTHSVV